MNMTCSMIEDSIVQDVMSKAMQEAVLELLSREESKNFIRQKVKETAITSIEQKQTAIDELRAKYSLI